MNDQPGEKPSLETLNKHLEALKKTQAAETKPLGPTSEAAKAAIDFASASAVGVLLGYGVDHYCGTGPWGIVIGLTVGAITGGYLMFKAEALEALAKKQNDDNQGTD